MEHFEQINETSYLSVQNAPVYRKIMRCFYREYEKMHFQLYKEDIYRFLKEDEAFEAYSMEQLVQDLEALVKWKNLTPIQDPGKVYTIADALYKKGYQIYFYKNETTKREIDVIIQKDGKLVPIEVKSGNTQANSLKWLMKNDKDISYGYKFVDGNIGMSEEGIVTLPLYMSAFI